MVVHESLLLLHSANCVLEMRVCLFYFVIHSFIHSFISFASVAFDFGERL